MCQACNEGHGRADGASLVGRGASPTRRRRGRTSASFSGHFEGLLTRTETLRPGGGRLAICFLSMSLANAGLAGSWGGRGAGRTDLGPLRLFAGRQSRAASVKVSEVVCVAGVARSQVLSVAVPGRTNF